MAASNPPRGSSPSVPPLDFSSLLPASSTSETGVDSAGRHIDNSYSSSTSEKISDMAGSISSSSSSSSSFSGDASARALLASHLGSTLFDRLQSVNQIKSSAKRLMDNMIILSEQQEIAEFLAKKPSKSNALDFLKQKIAFYQDKPLFFEQMNHCTKVIINLTTADSRTKKSIFKNYKKMILPGLKTSFSSRYDQMAEAKQSSQAATKEARELEALSILDLSSKAIGFIEAMRPPEKRDFSSQLECEFCLEGLKYLLLKPEFVQADPLGVEWRGGEVKPLSGASGGVYALGMTSLEEPPRFKAFLVAKLLSEEPGELFGEVFSDQLRAEIKQACQNPDMVPEYNPIRVGIAPGKGVLNEYLESLLVFSKTASSLCRIRHPSFKNPEINQVAALIGFVENEGSFDSLSKAQGYLDQAEFALESAKDEAEKTMLLDKIALYKLQLEKAAALKIEQKSSLSSIEERVEFESFEDVMVQDILTRNQDIQAQNVLVVGLPTGQLTLKTIDHGAIFSSLYQTKNQEIDLPCWCELRIANQPIALRADMKKKLYELDAGEIIANARRVYRTCNLSLDIGAELGIRASVALLKSSLQRVDLTFIKAARMTFLPTDDGFKNELAKAINSCLLKFEQNLSAGAVSIEEKNGKLDEYLLEYFQTIN